MTSKKTVLVVDDELDLREILRDEFEYLGFSVLDAENGSKGFEKLQANTVDVIVSDIRMPGGNGIELLRRVMELSGKKPPVILVSAFADISAREAEDKGAFAYVSKPYDLSVLMEFVNEALKGV